MLPFATLDTTKKNSAILKVVGVGGGGCNAIESMIRRGLVGVEYVAINTDAQVLEGSNAQYKVQVGAKITKGLGAGADPNVGKKAIEEDREKITEVLNGSDMVFVTAGMGGGTGTGGAPIVASIAKSLGALVVGIVTKPFRWEGKLRMLNAEKGIQELRQFVDSLIVIPNERLLSIVDKNSSFFSAFDKPNEVLYEATRGIADIITVSGLVNVDFADVRTIMNQSGVAIIGCGIASGENRAIEAAQKAISSPLLDGMSIKGAKSILLNITGSNNLTMQEVDEGNTVIYEAAGEEANIIFGCVLKEDMNDYVSYTVIATGFNEQNKKRTSTEINLNKKKESYNFTSSIFSNLNEVDLNDIETPTILRSELKEKEEEDIFSPGFNPKKNKDMNFEELKKSSFQDESKKNNDEDDDDDEASSFLRMVMD
ncbi:MAG: cell division protein FtsZ [Ignavibacterium sp.]